MRAKDLICEALAASRLELANVLRADADAEASGYVAARLREIAAAFEAGQKSIGGETK
jgi:hypothetical protein